jgi:two-component system phosphate regulon sensor histidine kinase PhoR
MSVFLYITNNFNWVLVPLVLLTYVICFIIIQYRVERFIYRRVKRIYDDLTLLESTSLRNQPITTDMGTLTREIDKYARDKKLEIETLKIREEYRKEYLGNVSH